MSHFAIVDLFKDNDELVASSPEELQLFPFPTPGDVAWQLCEVVGLHRLSDDDMFLENVISGPVEKLLRGGLSYPPALAIALQRASGEFLEDFPSESSSKQKFLELVQRHLRLELQRQLTSKHVLAEASRNEGYVAKGNYYWLVGYDSEKNQVEYVSPDFYLYCEQADAFSVDTLRLQDLARAAG